MIQAEVAIYPQKTTDASNIIKGSISALQNQKVEYSVNSMNTLIKGSKDEVFNSLASMFSKAENAGAEINMVVTLSNSAE